MRYFQQFDSSDCGAACLAMIFSHYKSFMTVTAIREMAGTDINGTSFKGLVTACEKSGFEAIAVKGKPEKLEIDTPCIAHIEYHEENKPRDHYVVIKSISRNKITVWDPDSSVKKKRVSYKKFKEDWTGNLLFVKPGENFEPVKKKDSSILWQFVPVILKHKRLLVYAILSSIILLIFGLGLSFCNKYLYDEVLFAKTKFSLNALFIGMIGLKLLSLAVETARSLIVRHFSVKTDLQLNFSFIKHLFQLPVSFFESRKTGEILSRLSDLSEVKDILSSIAMSTLIDVLLIIAVAPILLITNYQIFLISVICAVLIGVMSVLCSKYYKQKSRKLKDENAEVSSYIVDAVNGVNVIKSLNAEKMVFNQYEKKQMKVLATSWKTGNFGIKHGLYNSIVNIFTDLVILWFGCNCILDGTMTLGMMFFLTSLSGYLIDPLLSIAGLQNTIQRAMVSAERAGEILCLEKENKEEKLVNAENLKGDIEFKDVYFHYGSRPQVLKGMNFSIKEGSSVGFVGNSGCGKTTTVKLLLKFYAPEKGQILIDGYDITDIDTQSLRRKIGYVPQDTYLFPDTIANNIAMCDEGVPLEKIIHASELAGIHNHIVSLPDRYNTKLGENGSGLSGGEKQRIAISRALLNNPSIVILDEATSNLDSASENRIHELVARLQKENTTVIIVSHRESTIAGCDNILFFKDGVISDFGKHSELMNTNEDYRNYWKGQLDEHC